MNGLDDPNGFVRVVRSDKKRRGLLYAGTETGLYVSNDDGANWEGQFSSLIQKGILGGLNTLQPVVSIFPNPSKEKFYITADGKIRLVNIWSIEGKSMGQYRFNSEKVELILNDYKAGTYYIEIQTEIGRFLRRLIRN